MANESTSPSLIARLRDPGNALAWSEFEARYGELFLCYCRRRGLQTADAEDVRQRVMLSLSRALRGFRYDPRLGRFRDYLGRVVQNAIRRHLARKPGTALLEQEVLELAAADENDALDEQWELDWMHHHMRLAMKEIERSTEPASLEVFERIVAGQSVSDVARASGKSIDAVHKIMQRVRDRLREQVERQVRDEDVPDA